MEFARELKEKLPVEEIYLFGSFAREEVHEGSDIDLILIGDFEGKMPKRIDKILQLTDLPVEPLCYTKEEFERLKTTSSFIRKILKTARKL
jgi:predicted nucleotidyltransferase